MTAASSAAPTDQSCDDLPTVQCLPGPSDAELEAQSDADYARDVAVWMAMNPWAQPGWIEATRLAEAACEALIGELSELRDRTVDHDVQSVAIGQVLGARAALQRVTSVLKGNRLHGLMATHGGGVR